MDGLKQDGESTQITLIDGSQQRLQPVFQVLEGRAGCQVRLFSDTSVDLAHLSTTDVLLLDGTVANQPKSSQFVDVPLILILTQNGQGDLPPWLQRRAQRLPRDVDLQHGRLRGGSAHAGRVSRRDRGPAGVGASDQALNGCSRGGGRLYSGSRFRRLAGLE